jgi:hypothetical protein
LIRVDAKDVTPVSYIDKIQEDIGIRLSLLNDPEIIKKFIGFLNDTDI